MAMKIQGWKRGEVRQIQQMKEQTTKKYLMTSGISKLWMTKKVTQTAIAVMNHLNH